MSQGGSGAPVRELPSSSLRGLRGSVPPCLPQALSPRCVCAQGHTQGHVHTWSWSPVPDRVPFVSLDALGQLKIYQNYNQEGFLQAFWIKLESLRKVSLGSKETNGPSNHLKIKKSSVSGPGHKRRFSRFFEEQMQSHFSGETGMPPNL